MLPGCGRSRCCGGSVSRDPGAGAGHPQAQAGLAILNGEPAPVASVTDAPEPVDQAVARSARVVHASRVSDAVSIASAALTAAPPGNGGWLLAVEPLLHVGHHPEAWAPALAVVHLRALTEPASAHIRLASAFAGPAAANARLTSAHVVHSFSGGGRSPERWPDLPEQ